MASDFLFQIKEKYGEVEEDSDGLKLN